MYKMPAYLTVLLLWGATASFAAQADELADAALNLCEKMKACAMAEIDQEDMTPQMRQMLQPMLDNMCANMKERIQEVPTGHVLYKPAVACMRSMEALGCEGMQSMQGNTPECDAYEKLARETYGDG